MQNLTEFFLLQEAVGFGQVPVLKVQMVSASLILIYPLYPLVLPQEVSEVGSVVVVGKSS